MPENDNDRPDGSSTAATVDAGSAQRQTDRAVAPHAVARPDYDNREEAISEQRKPMGPALKEDDADGPEAGEAVPESRLDMRDEQDEPPLDPA